MELFTREQREELIRIIAPMQAANRRKTSGPSSNFIARGISRSGFSPSLILTPTSPSAFAISAKVFQNSAPSAFMKCALSKVPAAYASSATFIHADQDPQHLRTRSHATGRTKA